MSNTDAPPDSLADSELSSLADLHLGRLAPVEPPPELSASIKRECTKDMCPAARLSSSRRVVLSALLLVGIVAGLQVMGRARDHDEVVATAVLGSVAWAAVMLGVLVVGLARPPGKRLSRQLRVAFALVVPALFVGYLVLSSSHSLSLTEFHSEGHAAQAAFCGLHTVVFSAIASAGVLFIWRRTDPLTPRLSGALAGLVGGLAGALAIGPAASSS